MVSVCWAFANISELENFCIHYLTIKWAFREKKPSDSYKLNIGHTSIEKIVLLLDTSRQMYIKFT